MPAAKKRATKKATNRKAPASHSAVKTKRPASRSSSPKTIAATASHKTPPKAGTKLHTLPSEVTKRTTVKASAAAASEASAKHLGGFHTEANAVRNLLAHRRLMHPTTGEPLSEPLILGIGGGCQPGYSFCPSVGRHQMGSGIYIVSKASMVNTGPAWPLFVLGALGCSAEVHESSGIKGATTRVREDLADKNYPLVWVNHVNMPYLGLDCSIGCQSFLHLVVVYAMDEAAGTVTVGDVAPVPIEMSLADLNAARERVCSFKNRSLRLTSTPKSIDAAMLKRAVSAGIRIYLDNSIAPRMKTFSIEGLEEWARMIGNSSNKKGWLSVFKGGEVTRALRDAFLSIETDNSPGGLMRGVYAEFLEEAAALLGKPKLHACAKTYRGLATQWTALAESLLPDSWHPTCAESKRLIRQRDRAFIAKGSAGWGEILSASARLGDIEREWLAKGLPVSEATLKQHMDDMSKGITSLVAAERAALAELAGAV